MSPPHNAYTGRHPSVALFQITPETAPLGDNRSRERRQYSLRNWGNSGRIVFLEVATQCQKQAAYSMLTFHSVSHRQLGVYCIVVIPAFPVSGNVASHLQVSNYLLNGPLSDTCLLGNLPGCDS